MAHFDRRGYGKPVRRVADRWLELNVQVGQQANEWSRRKDLVAYIGEDGGRGMAAALYDPISGEIEVNTVAAFGVEVDPSDIGNFTHRETHFEWPQAAGALLHEAGHAQYTTLAMCKSHEHLTRGEDNWFELMDEPRIEYLMGRQYPENREFLRACALGIVLKDSKEGLVTLTAVRAAAHLAVLSVGRIDGGILKKKDVKNIRRAIRPVLPDEVLAELRELWREFLNLKADGDLPRMLQLAREFEVIVAAQEKANGDMTDEQVREFLEGLFTAIGGDKMAAQFDAEDELDGIRTSERIDREHRAKVEFQMDQDTNKVQAKNVFSAPDGKPGATGSRLKSERDPYPEERAAATKLAQALKNAKYRDRTSKKVDREVPPGRLHMNAAIQKTAARKVGGNPADARPFRDVVRKHVEDPNLTVGVMCDVSGSMGHAMEPIGVSTWILSNAGHKAEATTAAVYFGASAFATLRPGETQKMVKIYSAPDNYEQFDGAFRALDGGLNLLTGTGPRILFICSDAGYKQEQPEAVRKWLSACRSKGVAVVWLDYSQSTYVKRHCQEGGATYVSVGQNVLAAADIIGQACTDALQKASR